MTEETAPQGDGPLTREAAVAMLVAADAPQEQEPAPIEAAPAEEIESEPATTGEDTSEASEPGDGETEESEGEAEAPVVEAPQWWDAEDKATFATLTPEQQAVIRKQEDKREAIVAKTKAEAAEARKTFDGEVQGLKTFAEQIGEFLPKAVETFKSRWEDVDWQAWADQDPQAALKGQLQMQAEQAELMKISQAKEQAEQASRQAFMREQSEALKELAPDLYSNPVKRREVGEYLVKAGIPQSNLNDVGAVEMTIAHKAMLWDQSQSKAKAAVIPLKPKPAVAKTVAPVAAPTRSNSQQRDVDRIANRFAQTKSREDAVALMIAKGL